MKVAIIPVRAGSKGLPNKNILPIGGKPMVAWSIEAARQSDRFDRIIVSTDSEEYAEICRSYGAEVMMRSPQLASDTATSYEVIVDVLDRINEPVEYFMLLQATSPMRTQRHVCEACDLFEAHAEDRDFLISMTAANFPACYVQPIDEDQTTKHFIVPDPKYRRQNYRSYSPNGALYMAKPREYRKQKHFFGERSTAYLMSKEDSVDVDDLLDYKFACLLMEERQNRQDP